MSMCLSKEGERKKEREREVSTKTKQKNNPKKSTTILVIPQQKQTKQTKQNAPHLFNSFMMMHVVNS